jgi:hypothetical protein
VLCQVDLATEGYNVQLFFNGRVSYAKSWTTRYGVRGQIWLATSGPLTLAGRETTWNARARDSGFSSGKERVLIGERGRGGQWMYGVWACALARPFSW